jgi:hypothetical protein
MLQGHGAAVRPRAPRGTGLGEEDQGEQSPCLQVPGCQGHDGAGEREGRRGRLMTGELVPGGRGVTGRVEQEHRGQHVVGPGVDVLGSRTPEPDPLGLDPFLRTGETGRHRRLLHEQQIGDLRRGHSADGPECEAEPRLLAEVGVARHVDQLQAVVGQCPRERVDSCPEGITGCAVGGLSGEPTVLPRQTGFTPLVVDDEVLGGRGDPRCRVPQHLRSVCDHSAHERLLHAVLGELQVAGEPEHAAQDARPLLPEDHLQRIALRLGRRPAHVRQPCCEVCPFVSITGNSSTQPAVGTRAASSRA